VHIQGYRKFRNQHIIGEMSVNRCSAVIRSRHITKTGSNECKETNTFIVSPPNPVIAVCEDRGTSYGTMTRSVNPFHVIRCTLRNQQGRYPNCEYRGYASTRYIAVNCEGRLPVHYDGDIVLIDS
uniref:Ribonuclease A-domain domain-containing protein n=1 Tax=Sphaeramia orbicularis TaxID=375764 RepID=A0A672YYV8_9TELE